MESRTPVSLERQVDDDVMENRCFLHTRPNVEGHETNEMFPQMARVGLDVTTGE